jgi:pimeloyl-ACP methyl ester carboxylesterase
MDTLAFAGRFSGAVLALAVLTLSGCSSSPASVAPPNLEVSCSGEGTPTVVMAPGLNTDAAAFESLQQVIATDTRVCSYSRAGVGESPAWPEDESDPSAGAAADQLRATLDHRGIRGPYVVLGWSYGGLVAQAFVSRYRSETAGLILVDSSVGSMFDRPDFDTESFEEGGRRIDQVKTRSEVSDLDFGDLPTVILTRGQLDGFDEAALRWWTEEHDDLVHLSSDSLHLIAFDAGHAIHWDSEALVEKAVDDVVEAARSGDGLAECNDYDWAVYSGECRAN